MGSREKILAAVKASQPDKVNLPDLSQFNSTGNGSISKFAAILEAIGGKVSYVSGFAEVSRIILNQYGNDVKMVSPVKELNSLANVHITELDLIHNLHDVEVAILKAHFAVAENGAVWVTDDQMMHRVLPFITQHLAVIINAANVVQTMHQAYELISKTTYDFGTFIAGPSKTADIEQSLVIGAHGPRSMTVFIINDDQLIND